MKKGLKKTDVKKKTKFIDNKIIVANAKIIEQKNHVLLKHNKKRPDVNAWLKKTKNPTKNI